MSVSQKFYDLNHLPRSASIKMRDNILLNHPGMNDINIHAYLKIHKKDGDPKISAFRDLEVKDKDGKRVGWEAEFWGSRALRNRRLGDFGQAVNIAMNSLYMYCPVDTGFGITCGIRYAKTRNGAKIIIGKGIAEYLVHQSYPRPNSIRAAQNVHELWIDDAIADARGQLNALGFKIQKDHLRFGSMQLYITRL